MENISIVITGLWKTAFATKSRSSRPEVFFKRGVLKSFAKFTGKPLCQRLFLKLAQVFSCEFCENFKNTFFIEHLWWQLLQIDIYRR